MSSSSTPWVVTTITEDDLGRDCVRVFGLFSSEEDAIRSLARISRQVEGMDTEALFSMVQLETEAGTS